MAVKESDAGSAIKCRCGRRVEVPLLEEFEQNPNLLSAPTLEARILRLVAAEELPEMGRCACCDAPESLSVWRAFLDCERSSVHVEGGLRLIYVPFLFWMLWEEKRRVEVRGHDTVVPAPICMCDECQRGLREPTVSFAMLLPLLLIPIGLAAAFLHLVTGVVLVGCGIFGGLIWAALWYFWTIQSHQKRLKQILARVPVYRQMMASYPYATVVMPST